MRRASLELREDIIERLGVIRGLKQFAQPLDLADRAELSFMLGRQFLELELQQLEDGDLQAFCHAFFVSFFARSLSILVT